MLLDKLLEDIAKDIDIGSVQEVLLEYGVEYTENSKPYYIDSTDFSLTEHYPGLLFSAKGFFSEHSSEDGPAKVMMVIGGTDTKEIYANLLSKDLMQHGLLTKDIPNSLFFLSSMASFGENPARIGNYFCAALSLMQAAPKGAFALIAKDSEAKEVEVHGVTGKFTKISSKLTHSFRSDALLLCLKQQHYKVDGEVILPDSAFITPSNEGHERLCIAPPLMQGNHPAVIVQVLKAILDDRESPIEGIIIEGVPGFFSSPCKNSQKNIVSLTQALTERGIQLYCLNEKSYNERDKTFTGCTSTKHWDSSMQLKQLTSVGAVTVNDDTVLGCYVSAVLGLLDKGITVQKSMPVEEMNHKVSRPVALRYIPDPVAFEYMLDVVSRITKDIVIGALPDNAIPQRHAKKICELSKQGINFHIGFRYNGMVYEQEGERFKEGETGGAYAAHLFPEQNDNIRYCSHMSVTATLTSLLTSNHITH